MASVVIFAPLPVLSVTVEEHEESPDVHIHAAGQGIWQARMLRALGVEVTLCAALGGETGDVLRGLIEKEGIELLAVESSAHNGTYIHDRRGGDRSDVVESVGGRVFRHDLDELYGLTLRAGMDAGTVILSGTANENIVPAEVYRRLAADLNTVGAQVIADLSGQRMTEALAGGLDVLKVADDELEADGRSATINAPDLVEAMHQLVTEGARHVIVTRADQPALLLSDAEISEVIVPALEVMDSHGAGDSLTAGVASVMAVGGDIKDAVTLGSAAGALNVTRHGLGSGNRETVHRLRQLVKVQRMDQGAAAASTEQ